MDEKSANNELSLSAEVTQTGIKASVKSRWLSAWDRLGGAKTDHKGLSIEAENAEAKAYSDARIKIITTLGDMAVVRLKSDPEISMRAVGNFLSSISRRQENKESVLNAALEDLRLSPPSEEEQSKGSEKLDDGFLNRFERHAEDASTEDLQIKWAKILSSEVRNPGTFSAKVLRIVDELDSETARLFERVCLHRAGNVIFQCLSGDLPFGDMTKLVSAGLLIEGGGMGHIRKLILHDTAEPAWYSHFGKAIIVIPKDAKIPDFELDKTHPISSSQDAPCIPVYLLTDAGHAISSILPDRDMDAAVAYAELLATVLTPLTIAVYSKNADGKQSYSALSRNLSHPQRLRADDLSSAQVSKVRP